MSTNIQNKTLAHDIRSLLSGLRWRIRAYVVVEGLAVAAIWLGTTFWIGLGLDYGPVLMGASETPVWVRVLMLLIVGGVGLFILFKWVLHRAVARLKNRSMAMLVERRYPDFHDSLLTAVQLHERPASAIDFDLQMLERTDQVARELAGAVNLRRVFNLSPILSKLAFATAIVASVVAFAVMSQTAFATWTSRLYLLSDDPWPRRTHIEVLEFGSGVRKVGRGSDVSIRVRADAERHMPPPQLCTIHYRTEEGHRGRANMTRVGAPRDGYQYYEFSGRPFKGILSGIRFDVVGYDHRVRDYEIQVVEPPSILGIELDCEMPDYTKLLAHTTTWQPGMSLPRSSRLVMRASANKALATAQVVNVNTDESVQLQPDLTAPETLTHDLDELMDNLVLDISLQDTDGVKSRQPYRITLDVVEDQPPMLDITLRGIGAAITSNARIPVEGRISDDYGIARTWFDVRVEGADPREFDCPVGKVGRVASSLDLHEHRTAESDSFDLNIGDKIILALHAEDNHDLEGGPNVGQSDRYQLEIVSASDLLARLEARELGLRRRFEQMISELRETRDSLVRVKKADSDVERKGDEPGEATVDGAKRELALRNLRVERAIQHSQRAAQEVAGVAASFDDIREELINNRIESKERQERIESQISLPLKEIADGMFPKWDQLLADLMKRVDEPDADSAVLRSVAYVDQILLAMEQVLEKMLALETYNELLDVVRSLIRDQDQLLDRTKKQRSKDLKKSLFP